MSRVLKALFSEIELHYTALEIYNSQDDSIPYINSGTGFCMYQNNDKPDDKFDLDLEVESDGRFSCYNCGRHITEDNCQYHDGNDYCERCFDRLFSCCDKCEEFYLNEDVYEIHGHNRYTYVCEYCRDSIPAYQCYKCDEWHVGTICAEDSGNEYCNDCADELNHCEECDKYFTDEITCGCADEDDAQVDDAQVDDAEVGIPLSGDVIMTNETVKIAGLTDYQNIQTYRIESTPGLFAARINDCWSVTHRMSGRAVRSNCFNLYNALNIIRDAALID